jgi:hypothetical protein
MQTRTGYLGLDKVVCQLHLILTFSCNLIGRIPLSPSLGNHPTTNLVQDLLPQIMDINGLRHVNSLFGYSGRGMGVGAEVKGVEDEAEGVCLLVTSVAFNIAWHRGSFYSLIAQGARSRTLYHLFFFILYKASSLSFLPMKKEMPSHLIKHCLIHIIDIFTFVLSSQDSSVLLSSTYQLEPHLTEGYSTYTIRCDSLNLHFNVS